MREPPLRSAIPCVERRAKSTLQFPAAMAGVPGRVHHLPAATVAQAYTAAFLHRANGVLVDLPAVPHWIPVAPWPPTQLPSWPPCPHKAFRGNGASQFHSRNVPTLDVLFVPSNKPS